jgi:hypothetical protein
VPRSCFGSACAARASTARSSGGRSLSTGSSSIFTVTRPRFSDYDKGRGEVLERLGLRVIRFANAEVFDEIDIVLGRIYAAMRLPFD